jgi:hypothetical protein
VLVRRGSSWRLPRESLSLLEILDCRQESLHDPGKAVEVKGVHRVRGVVVVRCSVHGGVRDPHGWHAVPRERPGIREVGSAERRTQCCGG